MDISPTLIILGILKLLAMLAVAAVLVIRYFRRRDAATILFAIGLLALPIAERVATFSIYMWFGPDGRSAATDRVTVVDAILSTIAMALIATAIWRERGIPVQTQR